MAEATSIGGQSYARIQLNSLMLPPSDTNILTTSFRPSFEAQRKMRVLATVGSEVIEILVEFRDEVFEPTTIQGESKYKEDVK